MYLVYYLNSATDNNSKTVNRYIRLDESLYLAAVIFTAHQRSDQGNVFSRDARLSVYWGGGHHHTGLQPSSPPCIGPCLPPCRGPQTCPLSFLALDRSSSPPPPTFSYLFKLDLSVLGSPLRGVSAQSVSA